MKEQLKQLIRKVDALTLRERVISFVMATVVLLFIVNTLLIEPQFLAQKKLTQQIQANQSKIDAIHKEIDEKYKGNAVDPDAANRLKLEKLRQQSQTAYSNLAEMQKGLVAPEKMASVMEDILKRNGQLRLLSLQTMPVAPLIEPLAAEAKKTNAAAPAAASGDAASVPPVVAAAVGMGTPPPLPPGAVQAVTNPGTIFGDNPKSPMSASAGIIYKHGVELTVQGSYPELLSYLAELEKMPWQLFWGKVKMNVEEYPRATLTLTVFTLSLDKKWLNL